MQFYPPGLPLSRHYRGLQPASHPLSRHYQELQPAPRPLSRHSRGLQPASYPLSRHYRGLLPAPHPLRRHHRGLRPAPHALNRHYRGLQLTFHPLSRHYRGLQLTRVAPSPNSNPLEGLLREPWRAQSPFESFGPLTPRRGWLKRPECQKLFHKAKFNFATAAQIHLNLFGIFATV